MVRQMRDDYPLRVAYFSPFPPDRSGIADYSKELLPYLAQFAEVTIYRSKPELLPAAVRDNFDCHDLSLFVQEHNQYDLNLYQMGNSEYHESFYPYLLRYPGIIDLHDYYLHHFVAQRTLGSQDLAAYTRELVYANGKEGYVLAQEILMGEKAVPHYALPLNRRVLDASLGLIVHSDYVAEEIRGQGFDRPLQVIPQIVLPHPGHSRRLELNLGEADLIFACFGLITTAKQVGFALEAFQRLRQTHPQVHFLLVGEAQPEADPAGLIQELGLADVVHHIGYVSDLGEFVDWIYTADVVINLRHPTAGETSASALRAMAAGRPVIVFDHGWYSEIPEGTAVKLPVMDAEALFIAMMQLADSLSLRLQVGEAARDTIAAKNHPLAVAQAYASALRATIEFYWQRYG